MADRKTDAVSPIDVQKALGGADYPAKKQDLVQTARDNGANDQIIQTLERIPDREYDGPAGVSKEIGNLS